MAVISGTIYLQPGVVTLTPSLEGGILHSAFLLEIPSLLIKGDFLALWGGGVLNTWPVKPLQPTCDLAPHKYNCIKLTRPRTRLPHDL